MSGKPSLLVTVYLYIFLNIFPQAVNSHPHTFIDNIIEIVFDGDGLAGFRIIWQFDEIFSDAIIADYDSDGNGSFSQDEIKVIKREAFSNLKEYNYFSDVSIDKKPFDAQFIQNFNPSITENMLVYTFFIPCHVKAAEDIKTIKFCMFDPTNFIDIQLVEEPQISLVDSTSLYVEFSRHRNPDKSWLEPEELKILFKKIKP